MVGGNGTWASGGLGYDSVGNDFGTPGVYPGGSSRIPQGRAQIYFASFDSSVGSASTLSAACQGDSTTTPVTPPDLTACAKLANPANYLHKCSTQLCQDLFTKYYGGSYSDAYNATRCQYDSSVTGAKAPTGCAFVIDNNNTPNKDGTRKVANPVSIPKINVMPDLIYNGGTGLPRNP